MKKYACAKLNKIEWRQFSIQFTKYSFQNMSNSGGYVEDEWFANEHCPGKLFVRLFIKIAA